MRADRKLNLSDRTHRALLLDEIAAARGWHKVAIGPARAKATTPQHAYYRAVILPIAKGWLNETQGADLNEDSAHEFLKSVLRPIPVIDKTTGEQVGIVTRSHAEYSVTDMIDYIDDVIELLARFDVSVPAPDPAWREKAVA